MMHSAGKNKTKQNQQPKGHKTQAGLESMLEEFLKLILSFNPWKVGEGCTQGLPTPPSADPANLTMAPP